jgi:hypothetical protein
MLGFQRQLILQFLKALLLSKEEHSSVVREKLCVSPSKAVFNLS